MAMALAIATTTAAPVTAAVMMQWGLEEWRGVAHPLSVDDSRDPVCYSMPDACLASAWCPDPITVVLRLVDPPAGARVVLAAFGPDQSLSEVATAQSPVVSVTMRGPGETRMFCTDYVWNDYWFEVWGAGLTPPVQFRAERTAVYGTG